MCLGAFGAAAMTKAGVACGLPNRSTGGPEQRLTADRGVADLGGLREREAGPAGVDTLRRVCVLSH